MAWLTDAWRRLLMLARRDEIDRGLDEEIRFHVDQQTEKNLRAGMPAEEARRRALIRFGGIESIRERTRDQFHPRLVEDSLRDLRYGLRSLARAPGFTLVATLTLALGIGATTAVFSVVNGVLIKPLPYPDSKSLVAVWHKNPGASIRDMPTSATQYFTYREQNRTFEAFGLWADDDASVTGFAEPEQVPVLQVTHGTLQALGVAPAIGRWFSQADDTYGSPATVILMHGYWHRRFGGDSSVLGRSLIVDSRPRTIIGVMPAGFRFLNEKADLILPFMFDRSGLTLGAFNYFAVARLKPDVTLTQASADIARMIPIWVNGWPAPAGFGTDMFATMGLAPALRPLKHDVVGDVGSVLWVLMGTIGIVLLIACANVANLLLVRAEGRQHELAMRAALGAGWGRIARELMLESVVLGLLGGAAGLGLAIAALRLLRALGPATLPRLGEITVDPMVVSFALAAALLSGVLFGLVPVLKHAGPHSVAALRGSGPTASDSRERHRARATLVVVQVALALVLMIASGLMVRTFIQLRAVDPGFARPDEVQLVRLYIPDTVVAAPDRVLRMHLDIRDRLAAIAGVAEVSVTTAAPMERFLTADVVFTEHRTYDARSRAPIRRFKFVSPGFFRTVRTPLIAGRDFTWADLHERRRVAIVSKNVARETWGVPGAAVGQRIRENPDGPWREVIGVVGDVYDDGVHVSAAATVYWPLLMENFWNEPVLVRRSVTFAMQSPRAGTESLLDDIQHAVWAVNRNLPLTQVRTLKDVHAQSMARTSFTLVMLAIAGVMALLLGVVGIYGVIAYAVTQRTREIGIRVALGAPHGALTRMFVRHGVRLASIGILCGIGVAAVVTRVMSSLLFGVSAVDPPTYLVVSVGLVAAAAIASYVPAATRTRVDPVVALRAE